MTARDVLRIIEDDGWAIVTQKGSHRQYNHPTKPGEKYGMGDIGLPIPGPSSVAEYIAA